MRRKRSKGAVSEAAEWGREREKLPRQQICLPAEAGKRALGLSSQRSSALGGKLYVQKAQPALEWPEHRMPDLTHPTCLASGCPHLHFAFFNLDLASEVQRSWGGKARELEGQ